MFCNVHISPYFTQSYLLLAFQLLSIWKNGKIGRISFVFWWFHNH